MDVIEAMTSTERIDEVLRVAVAPKHRRDPYWWAAVDRLLDQRLRITTRAAGNALHRSGDMARPTVTSR